MTANQIAYNKYAEDKRHNLVSEQHSGIQAEAAKSQAATAAARQREDARHNVETERVNWWNAQELGRHNLATEQFQKESLSETQRHNLEQERTNWFSAESTARYQSAQAEGLLRQLAVAERQAAVSERQATVSERQASVAERNAQTNASALAETIRHNYIGEAESARHNKAQESISSAQVAETRRSNLAQESLSAARNKLTEQQIASQRLQFSQQQRLAEKKLQYEDEARINQNIEQKRHNVATEEIQRDLMYIKGVDTASGVAKTFVGLWAGGGY